jgi:hypothetical protein
MFLAYGPFRVIHVKLTLTLSCGLLVHPRRASRRRFGPRIALPITNDLGYRPTEHVSPAAAACLRARPRTAVDEIRRLPTRRTPTTPGSAQLRGAIDVGYCWY